MTTRKTIVLTRQTFTGKAMSLHFNMLSKLVIAFLRRSKRLLISWLQSPSSVILKPKKMVTQMVVMTQEEKTSEVDLDPVSALKFLAVGLWTTELTSLSLLSRIKPMTNLGPAPSLAHRSCSLEAPRPPPSHRDSQLSQPLSPALASPLVCR